MKRKIAAILAADIAGYSKLVAEDEEETLRRLAGYRAVFDDFITRFGGRVFNTAGDGTLAEFQSAVDAVRCAVDVQESLRTRNLAYPPSRHMSYRIGITIGDVVERDGDLLGDGVNIASRLESLAPPGGICISRSVHEAVANKIALKFADLGQQQLKNMPERVHAYTASLDLQGTSTRRSRRSRKWLRWAAAILAIGIAGDFFYGLYRTAPPSELPDCGSHDPDRAIAACTKIITEGRAIDRYIAAAHFYRGNRYNAKGEYDRAIADYGEAIRLNPQLEAAYTNRGGLYEQKREYDRAMADLNEALRLDAESAGAYFNRGKTFSSKGEYDRAIADLDQAIRLDQKFAVAYNSRGNAYDSKGEYDRAIADFDEAIRLDPNLAIAYNNRAKAYLFEGEYDRALLDFSEAIRLDPRLAVAYANRGYLYDQKRKYDDAMADLNEALRLDPILGVAYGTRGDVYSDKREYDRAISDYSEAIRLDPDDFAAYTSRALTYLKMGKPAQGLSDADRALQLKPNDQTALNTRGHILLALGRKEEASKDLAGSKDPSVPASKAAPDGAGLDCRRYIPSAGISVAVSCTD